MSLELISMLGGGVTGFVMRLIAAQAESQARLLEAQITKQKVVDDSADRAANRSAGVWVRRFIAVCILFAVIIAPFILSIIDIPLALEKQSGGGVLSFIFGNSTTYENVRGFVLLPEVRQGMLALLSFYFGSSMVKR